MAHDLVIRGGTVIDGTGGPARTADVAVSDGTVTEVGRVDGEARRTIDAAGALVTPGFVDIHTHYDGQATWDASVSPSAWHGVTTVVMGNCGVGFAPVRPDDHDRLVQLMEGVEDIPGTALHEGLEWDWEGFGGYLDALDRRPHDIDVAAQVPHGALRLYVMGERGAAGEAATGDDVAAMADAARAAIEAGALGFTTSRTVRHRTSTGDATPSLRAEHDELVAIAEAVGATGTGVLQMISDFDDLDHEFAMARRMVERSGRPLSISVNQHDSQPYRWRELLDLIAAANADGLAMRAQVAVRPVGVLLGLGTTLNPFITRPSWRQVRGRPHAEVVATLADPAFRARLLAEEPADIAGMRTFVRGFDKMFPLGDPPDYEPPPEASVAARARREGRAPEEVAYDLLCADGGHGLLYFPLFGYTDGDLDNIGAMLADPNTLVGLGDGGAHCGSICDASFPTTLLAHWGRDRTRGERFELPWLVRRHTADNAVALGLGDRGVLAPGLRADVNVIDFDALRNRAPELVHDLPAGGRRLVQRAEGYRHTMVAGTEVMAGGEPTGAHPGSLVRGAR